jgi:hypothetical protein
MQKKPKELIKIRYYKKERNYSKESDLFKGSYGESKNKDHFNHQLLARTSLLLILIGGVTALTIQFFFNKNILTQIIKVLAILFYTSGFLGFIISIQKKRGIEK